MHVTVLVSERYLTSDRPLGGIFQYHQAVALRNAGLRIGVIAPEPCSLRYILFHNYRGGNIGSSGYDEIVTYRHKGYGLIPGRTPIFSAAYRLRLGLKLFDKYVNEYGLPDLIHAHNINYAGYIGREIKRRYGIPLVITEHSSAFLSGNIKRWQRRIVAETLRVADALIVVSPRLGQEIERQFGKFAKSWIWVPDILDSAFEKAGMVEQRLENWGEKIRILNVAALVPIKNHMILIEAFHRAFSDNKKAQLIIGGEGPLLNSLKHKVREYYLNDQVIFLGSLSRQQVLEEMRKCTFFVLPSQFETFGVVIIEALACGKPVIATDCGGPKYILNNCNGIIVPPSDVHALADGMIRMVKNLDSYDTERIRKDCINMFGEKAITEKLISIYNDVVNPC